MRTRPPRTAALIPARSRRAAASGTSTNTIAESPGSSPRPARKRFASSRSCAWIALDADLLEQRERGCGADPAVPGGRGVEPAGIGCEPQRPAEVRRVHVLAGEPAGGGRDDLGEPLRRDRHVRGAARREQPLVARHDDDVEAVPVEREPAAGLGCVDERQRAVGLGRRGDRGEVGHLAGRHLHGAERDDVGRASIAPASSAAGTVRTVTPRCAWTRNGKSVEVNSTSGASTRDPSGSDEATRPTSPETVAPTATVDGGDADEPRERPPRRLGRVAPLLPARPARAPVVERRLERIPGRPRRQPEARGVEVRPGRLPELLRGGDRRRHDRHPRTSGSRPH